MNPLTQRTLAEVELKPLELAGDAVLASVAHAGEPHPAFDMANPVAGHSWDRLRLRRTRQGPAPPRQPRRLNGFHPHKFRHTAAHRWLATGGSESGLTAMAGRTRTDMLVRYTRATATERAAQEARRLNLGDL